MKAIVVVLFILSCISKCFGQSIIDTTGIRWQSQETSDKIRHREFDKRLGLLSKKYGKKNAELIVSETIKIGMTKSMLVESWGKPLDINRTVTRYGTHEQWIYDKGYSKNIYVYLENGRVTSWQD